ncbi:ATP-binding protein [Streptomyces olivoreticuli]
MANMGQIDLTELCAMLDKREAVNLRAALVQDSDGWRLHHGEVNLDPANTAVERSWHYGAAAFLERSLPGSTVTALLRGHPLEVGGLTVEAKGMQATTGSTERLRGQQDWGRAITPWPRTEWTIGRGSDAQSPSYDVLVGDDDVPSFLNFDQAFSAFFYESPHNGNASRSDLWRIVLPQRDAWFARISIGPDTMAIDVAGDDLANITLELSTAATHQARALDGPGTYTFDLPDGLAPDSFLVLRRARDWLDQHSFPALQLERVRDDSVVWEQPGAELEILLASGEGQYIEAKREVPHAEQRKKTLKTIAAFTAQPGGGTVLIGVADDLEIVGLAEGTVADKEMLTVGNMIRDNIEPEPPYAQRIIDHDGKKVIAVEVAQAAVPCAYRNSGGRLEFFVRRGYNTVPARHYEITAGFQQ